MLIGVILSVGQIYDPIYEPTALVLQSIANGSPIIYVAVNYRLSSAFEFYHNHRII